MISKRSRVFPATAAALCALAPTVVFATTRSSFNDVDAISGITAPTSNGGFTFTVSLSANPTFTLGATTYQITDFIAFYALSDSADFSPLPALPALGIGGAFADDSTNNGPGAIAGWRSNPNDGLTPNQSLAFTFPANFPLSAVNRLGFHVRVNGTFPGTSGNTGNITGPLLIPSPGFYGLAVAAAIVAFPRRRRRAH